jgi:hypothetical protein
MRTKTFQVGDTIRLENRQGRDHLGVRPDSKKLSGLIVRKLTTHLTATEIYEVLLSNGQLVSKTAEQLQFVIIRQDGVEVNG